MSSAFVIAALASPVLGLASSCAYTQNAECSGGKLAYVGPVASEDECCAQCAKNPLCRAWTYWVEHGHL